MGLFDLFVNQVLGSSTTQAPGHTDLAHGLLEMLNSPQSGGLAGLVRGFEQSGLTHLIAGWVSTGPNPPATQQQIQQGLGADKIQQLAQTTGMQPSAVVSALTTLLPTIVDKLTPDGKVPQGNLLQHAIGLLGKL